MFIVTPVAASDSVMFPTKLIVDPDSVNTFVFTLVFENVIVPTVAFAMLFVDVVSVVPANTRFVVPLDDGAAPLDQLLPMFHSAVPLVPTHVVVVCAWAGCDAHANTPIAATVSRKRINRM